jgi:hypothetical protein
MPIGYELKTEGVSMIVNGKEFNLSTSTLLSRLAMDNGRITSMYQDEAGEYFIYVFEPRRDKIVRVDQAQANRIAEILNPDGDFDAARMHELADVGLFDEDDFDPTHLGQSVDDVLADIPEQLIDRHRELAAQHQMTFEAWLVQCLERATTTH